MRLSVDMQPFVEAGPAEEVAAEGDYRVLGQFEANVAFETACSIMAVAVIGAIVW